MKYIHLQLSNVIGQIQIAIVQHWIAKKHLHINPTAHFAFLALFSSKRAFFKFFELEIIGF